MVVLSGSVICSSVVMFDSSSMFRYLWLNFIGSLWYLLAFSSHISATGDFPI
jgi:glucan-binding YG repeat protein